jgi:hypothetical protein
LTGVPGAAAAIVTQRAEILDRVAIERCYDVAGLDSCFGRGAVRLGLGDERTLRALETQIIGNLRRHRLNLYAEPAARDVSFFAELVNNHPDGISRDRESDSDGILNLNDSGH